MPPAWSLPEKHLVTELAVGIARRLGEILTGTDSGNPEPGYLFHSFITAFEDGCDLLWRLGVAHAAYGPEAERKGLMPGSAKGEKSFPPYFKPFGPSEIRATLATQTPPSAVSVSEVVSAYVELACDFGPQGTALSSKREPFAPQVAYKREIDALARLGYVEQRNSMVQWTEKIAPTMQKAQLWEDDGRSSRAVAEETLTKETAAILAAISHFTKNRLAIKAKRASELDFVIWLRDQFDGLYPTQNPDGSPRESSNVLLVRRIYKILREDY